MEAGQEIPDDPKSGSAQPIRVVEDPIARFVEKHWQRALYLLVGAGFLIYLYFGYQSSQEEARKQAAELFNKVRSALQEVETAEQGVVAINKEIEKDPNIADQAKLKEREERRVAAEAGLKESRAKLEQRLSALSDVKEPYKTLSKVYSGVSALKTGDLNRAKEVLGQFDWTKVPEQDSERRFIAELAALNLGRALLDQAENLDRGKQILIDLAKKAAYVRPSAALAYARVASNDQERAEAKEILQKVQVELPHYGDLVREQLDKM